MKYVITTITFLVVLSSLIPITYADTKMMIPDENESSMEPVAFGNQQFNWGQNQAPEDMCVSDTGITFTVNMRTVWELIRSLSTRTSFIAWNSDGSLRWIQESSTLQRHLFGVTTDNSYVYTTGKFQEPYLAKYDYDGNMIWNTTWDFDQNNWGLTVDITDDGTIVVGGSLYNVSLGSFVIAFDSEGDNVWSQVYQNAPALACWENHVFISCDGLLEKRVSSGDLVWSYPNRANSSICVHGSSIYTIPIPYEEYVTYAHNMTTSFNVTRWDATTGEQVWTHTVGLYNSSHHEYDCYGITYAVDKNESIALLMKAAELENWYLVTLAKNGTILSCENLLDNEWNKALFEFQDDGQIRVVGYGSFGTGMALFDTDFPMGIIAEDITLQLIVVTVSGVVAFDTGLILYLRKRKMNRGEQGETVERD